LVWKLLLKD